MAESLKPTNPSGKQVKRSGSDSDLSINKVIEKDLAEQELTQIAGLFAELDTDGDQKLTLAEVERLLAGLAYVSEKDVADLLRPYNEWTLEKILNLLRTLSFSDDSETSSSDLDIRDSLSPRSLASSNSGPISQSQPSPYAGSVSLLSSLSPYASAPNIYHTSNSAEYGQASVNPEHEKLVRGFYQDLFNNKKFENYTKYAHFVEGVKFVTPAGTVNKNMEDLRQQLANVAKSEFTFSDFRSVGNELFFRNQWHGVRDDGTTFFYDHFNKWVLAEDGRVVSIHKAGSGFKIEGGLASWLAKRRKKELELQKKRAKELQKERISSEKEKEKERSKAKEKEKQKELRKRRETQRAI